MRGLFEHQAIIFDMDGVLIDTEPLYTVAYNQVMRPWGVTLDLQTKHEIMGRPPSVSIPHVIKKYGLPISPEDFIAARNPIMDQLLENTPAMPGAEQLVIELVQRGIVAAVATSTHADLFLKKTRMHPWFSHFEQIVCGDDVEVKNPKPAPDIFLVAAKRLGVDIKEAAIFEDSPAGLEAASKTGATVYPVTHQQALVDLLHQFRDIR